MLAEPQQKLTDIVIYFMNFTDFTTSRMIATKAQTYSNIANSCTEPFYIICSPDLEMLDED